MRFDLSEILLHLSWICWTTLPLKSLPELLKQSHAYPSFVCFMEAM